MKKGYAAMWKNKMLSNFEKKVIKLYRCDVYSSKWCRSINSLQNSVFLASLSGTQKRDSGKSNNNEKYTKVCIFLNGNSR